MFYRPETGHGLPRNPFTSIIAPRPIGWISTRGTKGDNLAPYSFFNAAAYDPPQVIFASTGLKDSVRNIRETGVFAVNIVGFENLEEMSESSASLPLEVDEFTHAGIERADCTVIDCPRVASAPATLECRLVQEIAALGRDNILMLGQVVGVHLRDDCMVEGRFDPTRFNPVARMGYMDYVVVREVITLARPGEK